MSAQKYDELNRKRKDKETCGTCAKWDQNDGSHWGMCSQFKKMKRSNEEQCQKHEIVGP